MWLLGDNYDKMKAVKFLPLFSAPQMVPPIVKNGDEVSCSCHCLHPCLSLSPSLALLFLILFLTVSPSFDPCLPRCFTLCQFLLNSDIQICNVFRTVNQSVSIPLRGCCPLMEENDLLLSARCFIWFKAP